MGDERKSIDRKPAAGDEQSNSIIPDVQGTWRRLEEGVELLGTAAPYLGLVFSGFTAAILTFLVVEPQALHLVFHIPDAVTALDHQPLWGVLAGVSAVLTAAPIRRNRKKATAALAEKLKKTANENEQRREAQLADEIKRLNEHRVTYDIESTRDLRAAGRALEAARNELAALKKQRAGSADSTNPVE